MNQILVTKKLYITPELKKKKKLYKFNFFLSIFLIGILISCYIYAEYDRNKSELVSQAILADMEAAEEEEEDDTLADSNVLLVVLDNTKYSGSEEQGTTTTQEPKNDSSASNKGKIYERVVNGYKCTTVATINIPKINVNYPILKGTTGSEKETEALLKSSPTEFWGNGPNKVGNFCIVGHNYRNKKFFSKVPTLVNGDIIEITANEETVKYSVYNKYNVDPTDVSCTTQKTNGKREITLITCTDDSKQRVIVKAREIK